MALPNDLLDPIPGLNPAGTSLRNDKIFAEIEEARQQDDGLPKGVWKEDVRPKRADFGKVAKLCREAIQTRSKDLQLTAWFTEALLHLQGFAGLRDGLLVCHGLIEHFWDRLYPELDEDGDPGRRAGLLNWIGTKLGQDCLLTPLTPAGYGLLHYEQSRLLPSDKESGKKAAGEREKAAKEGKLLPEEFDKAFEAADKPFYVGLAADLSGSLVALERLSEICRTKFDGDDVGFGDLRSALQRIDKRANVFLDRKREKDPDPEPVADPAIEVSEPRLDPPSTLEARADSVATPTPQSAAFAEPVGRREAIAAVAAAAAYLRKTEPRSPAPFLMLRGLRWGELLAAAAASNETALEAPPTELRTRIKNLVVQRKWNELLEAAEQAMALPSSRAWLDLQRMEVEACSALGSEYAAIAQGICSYVRSEICDLPQLATATLMDDTPAANAETRAWIEGLLRDPGNGMPSVAWRKHAGSWELAMDALASGDAPKAFEILYTDLGRQHCGRDRFRHKLQLVKLCIKTGKDAVAQPLLDDLAATLENHKLDEWEDQELVTDALLTIMGASKRIQADAKEKQKLFERICRLNPMKALSC